MLHVIPHAKRAAMSNSQAVIPVFLVSINGVLVVIPNVQVLVSLTFQIPNNVFHAINNAKSALEDKTINAVLVMKAYIWIYQRKRVFMNANKDILQT